MTPKRALLLPCAFAFDDPSVNRCRLGDAEFPECHELVVVSDIIAATPFAVTSP